MPTKTKTVRVRTNRRRGKKRVWKNRRVKVRTKAGKGAKTAAPAEAKPAEETKS